MRDYLLTLLVTAAVTYMLTPLVRVFARRIGAIKQPRDRDVHTKPIPVIGGVAMFGGLCAGLLVADQIPQLRDGFANTGMVSGLLLAGGLLVIVGIIDDRWGLSPLTKAAGQVAAGGILVATGTQLNWLPLPGGNTYVPTTDQATVLTILIVVATINAVNFIDGLDGLAAGIVAIAAISFFLYYYSMTKVIDVSALAAPALASAILIGMCLGFLPHNFSPASIFMGDTGSMLLGLVLAYAPISSITSVDPAFLASRINRYPEILPLLLPAALLVIPYADLLLAVIRRTRAGQSPFTPDRKHLHHRMLDIGHSQRASVLIMYLWAAVFSGTVVWLSIQRTVQHGSTNHHGQPILVLVAITGAAIVALLLLAMPKLRQLGRSPGPDESADSAEPARQAGLAGPAAGVAGLAVAGAAAGVANGTSGPPSEDPMELRPPAAAPLSAAGSAEPQLVAAAVVSRSAPLAAPVASNGSSSFAEPTSPTESTGWGASGMSNGSSAWAEPAPPGGSSAWPEPAPPGGSSAWAEPAPPGGSSAWAEPAPPGGSPGHSRTAELGADDARVSESASPSDADQDGQNGQNGHRSIIGTPPPAVTSLEPFAVRGANHDYRDRDDDEP